jgi:probable HAF family extracellular repeat protein
MWLAFSVRRRLSAKRRPRVYRPRLEVLEDRTVPSGSYGFTTIDDPNGVNGSFASSINARGQIVGSYSNIISHGFLLSGGQYTTLDDPNGVNGTSALGINASSGIVGSYVDANFNFHAFLFRHGKYTTIDDPNATSFSEAVGINSSEQIVGDYFDANGALHGSLLSHGQYTTIDDPNAGTGAFQGTYAFGINAGGQIVGTYVDANYVFHGYLLSGGQYTTIDDPNAVPGFTLGSTAEGINDHGQIVGYYNDANSTSHGYLLSGGQYTALDDPSAGTGFFPQGTNAYAINDSGKIVGGYFDANFAGHAFLASPTHGDTAVGAVGLGGGRAMAGSMQKTLLSTAALSSARITSIQAIIAASSSEANGGPGVDRSDSEENAVKMIHPTTMSTRSGSITPTALARTSPVASMWLPLRPALQARMQAELVTTFSRGATMFSASCSLFS